MYRILLVDDEKWVRTSIRKMIEKVNMPMQVVYEANNGIDAMDWLKSNKADIVVSDIRMPVMDGIALLKELNRRLPAADLVFVSGHDDFQYAQQGLRHGAFDYLLKPVEVEHLEECFTKWISKKERKSPHLDKYDVHLDELSPVEQVVRYLQAKPCADLSLSEAASMVHLNTSYFCKLFKGQKGVNYREYTIELRIKEAERLLQNTSLRVSEIAERVGYAELSYFCSTFKRITGHTPKKYRLKECEQSVAALNDEQHAVRDFDTAFVTRNDITGAKRLSD